MADIVLLAHRGSNPYPDHSRDAYVWAINWGADFIEPDLFLTKDGVLVSSHDNHNYANLTYAEAKSAEPGLLTFGEVIELAKAMAIETGRKIGVIPETKSTDFATSKAVIDVLIAHDFTDPALVTIQSFSSVNLKQLHDSIMPDAGVKVPLAFLRTGIGTVSDIATFADIVAPSATSFSAADVAAAHAVGLKVVAWTVLGAKSDIQRLVDLGVDAVFADDTQLARASIEDIAGAKAIFGTLQSNTLTGSAGSDKIFAMQADDIVRAGAGDDIVFGDGGNDTLFGGIGNDRLIGGAGDDFLSGGDGKDVLVGGAGNDVIVATGDQVIFGRGHGIDLISVDGTSSLLLDGIAASEISVTRDGANLILRAGTDAVVIRNGTDPAYRPATSTFADGVVLTGADLANRAVAGSDEAVAGVLSGLETTLATAPSLAQPIVPPGVVTTDLIVNGGFEDLTGASDAASWGFRNTSPAGKFAGWTNTADTRAEVHKDTVGGISAAGGSYWFDMEGANKNARLVQSVSDVVNKETYTLKFSIADTDTAQTNDTIQVYWGGALIYTGVPKNKWQDIAIDVIGGSGDGSNKLEFASTTPNSNGAGVALDKVSLLWTSEKPNLIVNGSFEDLTGAYNGHWSGDWGYRNDNGIIPGWRQTNTAAGGRAELHFDTQNGVRSKDGNIWFDLDGNKNAARLVQTVDSAETGATYRLTFSIADADATTSDDGVQVSWGGVVVYKGVPGAAWEEIILDVVGGSGDGSNDLVFEGTHKTLNGYGAALDDVSLRKIADRPAPNTAPIAKDDGGFSTKFGTPLTLTSSSLLANDTDADSDTLAIVSIEAKSGGSVRLDDEGDIVFTPTSGFSGQAVLGYSISDGRGGTASASVTITVAAKENTPPVAGDDGGFSTKFGAELVMATGALLANDSDADGDPLAISSITAGVGGTLAVNGAGDIVFRPESGFSGEASFSYSVSDGQGGSATASVTIQVEPPLADGGTTPTPNPNTPTPNPNAPTPFVPSTAVDPSPNNGFNEAKAAASVATFFTGTAPSAAKQAELNAFANLQFEAYQKAGVLNPAMGPYEALGRGFSETVEFSQKYAALTEAEFITARYAEVFGRDPSVAQQAHFQAQIDYFELIYKNAGVSSAQADIFAKGAVLGQMIGHAALAPVTATAQASAILAWDLAN